jgi:hypothetical protein
MEIAIILPAIFNFILELNKFTFEQWPILKYINQYFFKNAKFSMACPL